MVFSAFFYGLMTLLRPQICYKKIISPTNFSENSPDFHSILTAWIGKTLGTLYSNFPIIKMISALLCICFDGQILHFRKQAAYPIHIMAIF